MDVAAKSACRLDTRVRLHGAIDITVLWSIACLGSGAQYGDRKEKGHQREKFRVYPHKATSTSDCLMGSGG